ncbi:hypothetical protein NLU13_8196 [Sarocladium strictum]|uniref:Uncharacterized protein n=1 Tax=Sarocladium strictum TaxID=5046 RepID=A0AA39L4R5_SARSR|nr:hypothetical protein NLU13_8196 [Sarocladium strictum]
MLHATAQSPPTLPLGDGPPPQQRHPKRKAESQDNERLSKRLSLLNIEQDGRKVYVPVESPTSFPSSKPTIAPPQDDDVMQMDDSKHKVYIYNLDDELSDDDSDTADPAKLVFLKNIEKHLNLNRIPRHIIEKPDPEEEDMQVVLYSDPKSLSVPEERDSVRKAIIEARRRTRERQRLEREGLAAPAESLTTAQEPMEIADEVMELD